jgi:AraC family transcriptional regulator
MARLGKRAEIPETECLGTSEGTSWSGFTIGNYRCAPHAPIPEFVLDQPHVVLMTRGEPTGRWVAHGSMHRSRWRPGTTVLLDSDYALKEVEFDAARDALFIRLDASKAAAWLQEDQRRIAEPHVINADIQIKALAECMYSEVSDGCLTGALFAESISLALITHIWGRYAVGKPNDHLRNGLSTLKLRKIEEFVECNLGDGITLVDLAGLVELSPRHLCRSFKEATGMTPYRYVLRQRIARAKLLLREGKLPITEIALLLGFASHSHFSNCFRKAVGVSPSKFLRI